MAGFSRSGLGRAGAGLGGCWAGLSAEGAKRAGGDGGTSACCDFSPSVGKSKSRSAKSQFTTRLCSHPPASGKRACYCLVLIRSSAFFASTSP